MFLEFVAWIIDYALWTVLWFHRRVMCALHFWRLLACSVTILAARKFHFANKYRLIVSCEWLIVVLFGLFCGVVFVWCVCAQFNCDILACLLTLLQRVSAFLRINVSWNVSRELLIVVLLWAVVCGVIVVCCTHFIFDNYSRVRLQFLQHVSAFANEFFQNLSRELLIMLFRLFCGVVVVWCAQFIVTYSHIFLHFCST